MEIYLKLLKYWVFNLFCVDFYLSFLRQIDYDNFSGL